MCKFIGKSNEQILCKLSKSEILRLYSIVHIAMETTKTSNFTCQSKSFISIFSLVKFFQLVSCNLPLAMIWQVTYTHKLPKLCSATLKWAYFPHLEVSHKCFKPQPKLTLTTLLAIIKLASVHRFVDHYTKHLQ